MHKLTLALAITFSAFVLFASPALACDEVRGSLRLDDGGAYEGVAWVMLLDLDHPNDAIYATQVIDGDGSFAIATGSHTGSLTGVVSFPFQEGQSTAPKPALFEMTVDGSGSACESQDIVFDGQGGLLLDQVSRLPRQPIAL